MMTDEPRRPSGDSGHVGGRWGLRLPPGSFHGQVCAHAQGAQPPSHGGNYQQRHHTRQTSDGPTAMRTRQTEYTVGKTEHVCSEWECTLPYLFWKDL